MMRNFKQRRKLIAAWFAGAIALILVFSSITLQGRVIAQSPTTPQPITPAEWQPVEAAMGRSGTMQPGEVFKFSLPRSDLQVKANGVQIKPGLALGSWLAFKQMGTEAMVMGDLVLIADEVTPVMTKLQAGGIQQTALHNHILHESPQILYMHIEGSGPPVTMAQTIQAAIALTGTPLKPPAANPQAPALDLNTDRLNQIIGYKGSASGGVYKFSLPRAEKITENGMEIPPAMGTATAINCQPTGSGKAAITGDFVLIASEVNPVIKTLRDRQIEVTALHSHMLNEQPRTFYMHFWANDQSEKLAQGLRAALDQTNVAKPS
jgi:hypothetical protein